MKHGLHEAVASYIVSAQLASDGGKGVKYLKGTCDMYLVPKFQNRYSDGYRNKDKYIRKAIDMINRAHGHSGFSFYVTKGDEKAPILVYFNYRIDGERRQISFHSFDGSLEKYLNSKATCKHRTTWDKGDSRKNAEELVYKVLC